MLLKNMIYRNLLSEEVEEVIDEKDDSKDLHKFIDEKINESNNKTLDALREFMKQPNITQISAAEKDTTLNDDEINEVMSFMLKIQDEYFPEIPLNDELDKKFVWNISRIVYEAHIYRIERGDPIILSPLVPFYALLTEDPLYTMGVYWSKIASMINENIGYIRADIQNFNEIIEEEELEEELEDDES